MPGAGKQPEAIQVQIKELLEAGFDPTTIHRKLKVGRSSIYRMKRNLQQHGTAYMPVEMNKKNGRPKVLTAEQELEVRDWLRDPKNRTRYLDDLVWLIHDRFNIVCSTTTMSKLKRKWLKVIEAEESGEPLDTATHQLVKETHPDLSILERPPVPVGQTREGSSTPGVFKQDEQSQDREHDPMTPNRNAMTDEAAQQAAQNALQHQQQQQLLQAQPPHRYHQPQYLPPPPIHNHQQIANLAYQQTPHVQSPPPQQQAQQQQIRYADPTPQTQPHDLEAQLQHDFGAAQVATSAEASRA
ncbi:hypothetical protein Tdes44962_MAKER01036 [Teratosphaeria destructans]|uniref:Uncharacterized protein n=1 Tax=Teratosphaeria destructans TaxID=418781 RepID=A0A9W7VXU2_9PEZI|nr:hypothetical protein Tdes44962_MAKER01036 [Teratosphaeria destructans]